MVREPPLNPGDTNGVGTVEDRLSKIECLLVALVKRQQIHDWYDIDEFARLVGKAPFTVREWARLGRIHAEKRRSGRGAHPAWVVSHTELERYRREGLLPIGIGKPTRTEK
ncbi:MAG: helix-turn-helix domain-containing protein [Planctomycetaceae bacterium]|nr:helix-turn-helix domain-containing protein [Planctomycetaceae bacterium]